MSLVNPDDRRRFGRRPSSVNAYVELPGQLRLPCIIENISDGGALLRFTDGAAPTQSFRLRLEGTEFNLLCEIRHNGTRQLGVRFVKLSEGIALNNHLLRKIDLTPGADGPQTVARRTLAVSQPKSVRALRLALQGAVNPDQPAAQPVITEALAAPVEAPPTPAVAGQAA